MLNLLATIHFPILLSSIFVKSISRLRSSSELKKFESSAKRKVFKLDARGKSFIYNKKSNGPKEEP